MSDQNSGPLTTNFNTKNVKTGKPIIFDGATVKCRFAGCTERTIEGKGNMLNFEYHTLEMVNDVDGKPLHPGFRIYDRVYLYGKDVAPGTIPDRAIETVCKIQDAFMGTGDLGNKKGRPEREEWGQQAIANMLGKEAYIKVKAKLDGDNEGNDVIKRIALADMTA